MLLSETLVVTLTLVVKEASSSVDLHCGAQVGHALVESSGCQLGPSNAMLGQFLGTELWASKASLQSLSMVIGPLVMSRIFAGFSGEGAPVEFPGAPFMLASVLTGLALVIALGARRKDDGSANETTPENEPSPVSPREAE